MSGGQFTLAIETAVLGGSLSLWRGNSALDGWIGTREISKSQDILEEIGKILERKAVGKKSLDRIVVSRGPGSYTGIRIGMAIGLGLKKSLGCDLEAAAILPAMVLGENNRVSADGGKIITAVPAGRDQICWQNFRAGERETATVENQPRFSTIEEFFDSYDAGATQMVEIILHGNLYRDFKENYKSRLAENCILTDAGQNIAAHLARAKIALDGNQVFQPIYIRDG